MAYEHGGDAARMPPWLRRPLAARGRVGEVAGLVEELDLDTVCRGAACPNRGECFAAGTATFMVMGPACTRSCRFCAVDDGRPEPLDPDEPRRVAEAAARLGLEHVVITCVTRDDLPDGGAAHLASTVRAVRDRLPDATTEVLASDLGGEQARVDAVLAAGPDVFNHNVETVPRLYGSVRPEAVYERSLAVLSHAASAGFPVKSGLMVGLGETREEVSGVLGDLCEAGCSILTVGQYLRPSSSHVEVDRFVEPVEFRDIAREAEELGFAAVASGPFVRSSYRAKEMLAGR